MWWGCVIRPNVHHKNLPSLRAWMASIVLLNFSEDNFTFLLMNEVDVRRERNLMDQHDSPQGHWNFSSLSEFIIINALKERFPLFMIHTITQLLFICWRAGAVFADTSEHLSQSSWFRWGFVNNVESGGCAAFVWLHLNFTWTSDEWIECFKEFNYFDITKIFFCLPSRFFHNLKQINRNFFVTSDFFLSFVCFINVIERLKGSFLFTQKKLN